MHGSSKQAKEQKYYFLRVERRGGSGGFSAVWSFLAAGCVTFLALASPSLALSVVRRIAAVRRRAPPPTLLPTVEEATDVSSPPSESLLKGASWRWRIRALCREGGVSCRALAGVRRGVDGGVASRRRLPATDDTEELSPSR